MAPSPEVTSHFAEFANNTSPSALVLSSSTCVGLRYGTYKTIAAFLDSQGPDLLFMFGTRHVFRSCCGFANSTYLACTGISTRIPFPCPHSSVYMRYRNFNLLSIDYVFRPRLRSRLTQSRLLYSGGNLDIRPEGFSPHLAYHSGILSS